MIRPSAYNKRIIAHPDADSPYDRHMCNQSRMFILSTMSKTEATTITALARALGIGRDRTSSIIKTLGIDGEFASLREKLLRQ